MRQSQAIYTSTTANPLRGDNYSKDFFIDYDKFIGIILIRGFFVSAGRAKSATETTVNYSSSTSRGYTTARPPTFDNSRLNHSSPGELIFFYLDD